VSGGRLNRNPLYRQLKGILEELVKSDEFKVGEQFLTERQVAERFDVSRVTANKALSSLVTEGMLTFRKGIGTFIQDTSRDIRLSSVTTSFTNKTLAAGRLPSTRILRFSHCRAESLPAWICARLPLEGAERITVVERLRLADDVPMILERHYFRDILFPGLTPEDVRVSVYDMVTKKYRRNLAVMDETIRAYVLRGRHAALLAVPEGTPGFVMHFMPFDDEEVPLYFAEVIYRGDAYQFHNRLGPIQRGHSVSEDPEDFSPP
jgi:GntR family transcriptional regulator